MPIIETSVVIKRPKSEVYNIIRDIENFPNFVRDVKSLRIIGSSNSRIISAWEVEIEGAPVRWKEEDYFDNNNYEIKFNMLEGDYKSYRGSWLMQTVQGGTKLTVKVDLDWGIPVLEKYVSRALENRARRALLGMLRAVRSKAERPTYDYVLIIHPTNEELLFKYEPGMRNKPRSLVKKLLEWMSPFKASEIENLNSSLGKTAKGAFVMCPLLLEQMATLSPHKVMRSIIQTLEFAKSLDPKLIGLTAYTAISGHKGLDLTKLVNLPITTGANFTLATIPEAILTAADFMEINLDEAYVLLVGATSNIGKYCIDILSHLVCGIFIMAYNEDKLRTNLSELHRDARCKVHFVRDINHLIDKVNIVIIATNHIPQELDINKLNPGTVVFDASYPRRISNGLRDDILVIDGVCIKPPGSVNFNFDFGLPAGLSYPCMVEPMVLSLERRFESYSLGGDFDGSKIKEIMRLSAKHGFQITRLTSNENPISDEEIIKIKHNSHKKRKTLAWA